MALGTATTLALLGTLGAAGLQTYNTNKTLSKQDASAAEGIRRTSAIQQRADAAVNDQVKKLEASRSSDERAQRMDQYMKALVGARKKTTAGLENAALGEAFNKAGVAAAGDLQAQGQGRADLLAGVDAAGLQRQGEAFDFGRLATDIALFGRESEGQRFLTELRTRGIRRNPWLDAGASLLGGLSSGVAGRAGSVASAASGAGSGAVGLGAGALKALYGGGGR